MNNVDNININPNNLNFSNQKIPDSSIYKRNVTVNPTDNPTENLSIREIEKSFEDSIQDNYLFNVNNISLSPDKISNNIFHDLEIYCYKIGKNGDIEILDNPDNLFDFFEETDSEDADKFIQDKEDAYKNNQLIALKEEGNGNLQISGGDKANLDFENAQANGKQIRRKNSNNKTSQIENYTFTLLSPSDEKFLNTAFKVHLAYLYHQKNLKNLDKIEKEQASAQKELNKYHNSNNNLNNLYKVDKKDKEKKVSDSPTSFILKPKLTPTTENLEITEKFLEAERLKEERIKEKEKEKLKNKIDERKFYELSDILRTEMNEGIRKKDIIRVCLLVVEIKKKFDLAPQFSTAILKSA